MHISPRSDTNLGFLFFYKAITIHHTETETSIDRPPQPNTDSGYRHELQHYEYGDNLEGRGDYNRQPVSRTRPYRPSSCHLSANLREEEHLVRRVPGGKALAYDERPQDNLQYDGHYLTATSKGAMP